MKPVCWAALLNEKRVVLSTKGTYAAVDQTLLSEMLRPTIGSVHVDETWYLSAHPDVAEAVRHGAFRGHAIERAG